MLQKRAADHQDRKVRLTLLVVGLLALASAVVLMAILEFPE